MRETCALQMFLTVRHLRIPEKDVTLRCKFKKQTGNMRVFKRKIYSTEQTLVFSMTKAKGCAFYVFFRAASLFFLKIKTLPLPPV